MGRFFVCALAPFVCRPHPNRTFNEAPVDSLPERTSPLSSGMSAVGGCRWLSGGTLAGLSWRFLGAGGGSLGAGAFLKTLLPSGRVGANPYSKKNKSLTLWTKLSTPNTLQHRHRANEGHHKAGVGSPLQGGTVCNPEHAPTASHACHDWAHAPARHTRKGRVRKEPLPPLKIDYVLYI